MTNPAPTVLVPEYLTFAEAAAIARVTKHTMQMWVAAGKVPSRTFGVKAVRIPATFFVMDAEKAP
jgi:excisionase family DNA binding protein